MIDDRQILQFFGKRLRMARHAAHLSQDDLAKRLGTGQDTISHYESGRCRPDLTTLARLASVLGVTAGYFFPDDTFNTLNDAHRETLARLNSLLPLPLHYVLTLVQHFADSQQRHQFLSGLQAQDSEFSLRLFVERDLRKLEQDVMQRHLPPGDEPLQLLARFTMLLLMVIDLDNVDATTDDLLHRLAVSAQRLTLHLRSVMRVRETATGA